ncbi:hypothetical protein BJF85_10485 [Saccharomonospora sp. CUA-673]|nr:hypothetical protein BJF85_10485 [Saccharomonospora sp. CUA-673]
MLGVPTTPADRLDELTARFPFPFTADRFRYSTNVQPAGVPVRTEVGGWGEAVVDVDGEYAAELAERADIVRRDPRRQATLPHMRPAAWDAMLTLMRELSAAYPESFTLEPLGGDEYRWHNALLGDRLRFRYGDDGTVADPMAYIGSQVQEDIVLLDQREQLYADAGVVTFAADWNFGFDLGMSFLEIHGPVPRIHEERVITRAHDFLQRLQPHEPYRRTNWTLTVGRRLDVSTETYPGWGPERAMVPSIDDDLFGELLHLRVEVQHLIRLADSGAVMFLIRTHLLPLRQIARIEPWRVRMANVLAELPEDMADYKGLIETRDRVADWLRSHGPHSGVGATRP